MSKATTPATVAAALEWADLSIAAQIEVTSTGDLINPFTKEPIAKAVNGLLDVRRPANALLPKPENFKLVGSVAKSFAKWCFEKCACSGTVSLETARERFSDDTFVLPGVEVDPEQAPYAFVTGNLGEQEYGILYLNGEIVRIGKRTERGYVWAHPEKLRKERGDKMCPRSVRAESAEAAFKVMMNSFTGKFRVDAPVPVTPPAAKAASKAKTPPAKAPSKTPPKAVAKTAPKKVPTKK